MVILLVSFVVNFVVSFILGLLFFSQILKNGVQLL